MEQETPGLSEEERNRRIAELAYAIWQQEGCPEGREAEHWRAAEEALAAAESAPATVGSAADPVVPKPAKSRKRKA